MIWVLAEDDGGFLITVVVGMSACLVVATPRITTNVYHLLFESRNTPLLSLSLDNTSFVDTRMQTENSMMVNTLLLDLLDDYLPLVVLLQIEDPSTLSDWFVVVC
jgi:hypothetical protein